MAETVKMINSATGITKIGVYGFSWTTLLFGPFPALFRADFVTFIGYAIMAVIVGMLTAGFGAFLLSIVWAFFYNGFYTKKLLETGYTFDDYPDKVDAAVVALELDPLKHKQSEAPSVLQSKGANNLFAGEMSVSNDAYQIYLVKKYNIEKNATLEKYIIDDKLFVTVDEAIAHADEMEKKLHSDQLTQKLKQEEAAREADNNRQTIVEEGQIMRTGWSYRLFKDGSVIVKDEFGFDTRYKSMDVAKQVITWWK